MFVKICDPACCFHRTMPAIRVFVLAACSICGVIQGILANQLSVDQRSAAVGYPARIEQIVIPGPEVTTKPIENRDQPIVLRLLATYPHGTDFRYDMEYYGLEPGRYNLAEYLMRKSGESDAPMPDLFVDIQPVLSAGQMLPNELKSESIAYRSFYLTSLLVGGALWFLGLLAILFLGRGKMRRASGTERGATVADRLRPLVDRAVAGELNVAEQAELERVLVAFWKKKLRLEHLSANRVREYLRQHPRAGVMLEQLDGWLHRPGASRDVDVASLLQPYQTLNYDEL